jgi:hypothetical protein
MAARDMAAKSPSRRIVPRVTPEVIRRAYSSLAEGNPYFIYEEGREAVILR